MLVRLPGPLLDNDDEGLHDQLLAEPSPDTGAGLEHFLAEPAPASPAAAPAEPPRALPDEVPWGYVVSITRNGHHRKLHHVGSCRMVPGVDYKEFDVYGAVLPPLDKLNSKCKWCFGKEAELSPQESAEESFESSASSTEGQEPPAKAQREEDAGDLA